MSDSKLLQKIVLGGSILAAVASSLCCLGPLVFAGMGLGGFAAVQAFEKWRPLFLIATFALLALAWFLTYRKSKVACAGGAACVGGPAPAWSKVVLWCSTAVALMAAAFPNFATSILSAKCGATCCASAESVDKNTAPVINGAESVPKDLPPDRISIYAVPLVCPAAPQIGCGSHAKPILLSLEQQSAVAQAWLNSRGTEMALVWKAGVKAADRSSAVNAVTNGGQFEARELDGLERKRALDDFLSGRGWLHAREVDRLSEEEARIMAARLVRRIQAKVPLTETNAKTLQTEFRDVLTRRLTNAKGDQPPAEAEILSVLERHLDEKDVTVLKNTLPHNLRPLPGEE